ncbi:hypothetical protein MBLNU230_g0427t1 [Neophaeotheca triangularis]
MGLGAPKKRSKLSHDPNNTAWSNNDANFGHRMLAKQGWKPGTLLGAENAAQKEHLTAASQSHIRVMLRQDNAGLGADRKKQNAETFGLNLFSGVLGRLNGKSEEVLESEERRRGDVELRAWQTQRFGYMRFVRGGLLVGDKEVPKKDGPKKDGEGVKGGEVEKGIENGKAADEKKSKKRKTDAGEEEAEAGRKFKEPKKRKRDRDAEVVEETEDADAADKKKRSRKEKKARKQDSVTTSSAEASRATTPEAATKEKKRKSKIEVSEDNPDDKALRKQEKRARKEARRLRKEEKRQRKSKRKVDTANPTSTAASSESDDDDDDDASVAEDQPKTSVQKPTAAPVGGGRNAVRHRYIQQKRMASMNPQSMKEIFMVKA